MSNSVTVRFLEFNELPNILIKSFLSFEKYDELSSNFALHGVN